MTNEELDAELGRAFRERREMAKKVACLKDRIRRISAAATTLADNPHHAESLSVMESAPDIRDDVPEIRRCLARLAELDKLLS